ncbi:MAG: glycosyltransferase family 2 protein [bacterium]
MSEKPLVSIIIPHFNGKEILQACLISLEKTLYSNKEVILVDNGSSDGSVEIMQGRFPWLQIVRNKQNLGYAGGCNSGLLKARGKYVLLLNNDTVVDPHWLAKIVEVCEQDGKIAACQPKILSLKNQNMFDYAGAAGGLMDIFGFPFAKGRIFFTIEKDEHQYEEGGHIFWASGTAMLIRKSALDEVGNFDEDFFAHMEEIDLNWRLHLAGYNVISKPQARVYHSAGSTLKTNSYKKVLLNHRNCLIMLLKNYEVKNLIWIFPVRIFLEFVAIIYSLVKLDFIRIKAVCVALASVVVNFKKIMAKRVQVQLVRKIPDSQIFAKMYRGSIVFDYFIRGIRKVQDLKHGN